MFTSSLGGGCFCSFASKLTRRAKIKKATDDATKARKKEAKRKDTSKGKGKGKAESTETDEHEDMVTKLLNIDDGRGLLRGVDTDAFEPLRLSNEVPRPPGNTKSVEIPH